MYPANQKCVWDIRVSQGSRVSLTFPSFRLEDGYYKNTPPLPADRMQCNDAVKVRRRWLSLAFRWAHAFPQAHAHMYALTYVS